MKNHCEIFIKNGMCIHCIVLLKLPIRYRMVLVGKMQSLNSQNFELLPIASVNLTLTHCVRQIHT